MQTRSLEHSGILAIYIKMYIVPLVYATQFSRCSIQAAVEENEPIPARDCDVQAWRGTHFGMDSSYHFHFETAIEHSASSACCLVPEEPENNK